MTGGGQDPVVSHMEETEIGGRRDCQRPTDLSCTLHRSGSLHRGGSSRLLYCNPLFITEGLVDNEKPNPPSFPPADGIEIPFIPFPPPHPPPPPQVGSACLFLS